MIFQIELCSQYMGYSLYNCTVDKRLSSIKFYSNTVLYKPTSRKTMQINKKQDIA